VSEKNNLREPSFILIDDFKSFNLWKTNSVVLGPWKERNISAGRA
jgi:hypothetical protein